MYHIIEAMDRWLAPILTFTAEEIWQHLPGKKREESVLFSAWYTELTALPESILMNQSYWDEIRHLRDCVNKEIEEKRRQGQLGSALEAEVTIYCEGQLQKKLQAIANELRFVLITSHAEVAPLAQKNGDATSTEIPEVWLHVRPTQASKCERCWHRLPSVGQHHNHPGLCARCVSNIEGAGEKREYA